MAPTAPFLGLLACALLAPTATTTTTSLARRAWSDHGAGALTNPGSMLGLLDSAWEQVMSNQDGLMPPKTKRGTKPPPFSEAEAWHHLRNTAEGVVDSARLLLVFGVVPAAAAVSAQSPLHRYAALGSADEVKGLLEQSSALVDATGELGVGDPPLLVAAMMDRPEVVKVLLRSGADPYAVGIHGANAMMVAASMGHERVVEALIHHGMDPNTKHSFAGNTALHFAAEMGHTGVIGLLCDEGANAQIKKVNGATPLHIAADTNQPEAARELLESCDANVNALLNDDTTPLYLAAQRGFDDVVRVLVSYGATVDYEMPIGSFGKHVVSQGGRQKDNPHNLNLNTEVGNGATALHAAVENGHERTVALLLSLGAKQKSSMQGDSPLHTAAQYNHPEIARLLVGAGADVNKRGRGGETALHHASMRGLLRVATVLADAPDVDLDQKNWAGLTALSIAMGNGHRRVAEFLASRGATLPRIRDEL